MDGALEFQRSTSSSSSACESPYYSKGGRWRTELMLLADLLFLSYPFEQSFWRVLPCIRSSRRKRAIHLCCLHVLQRRVRTLFPSSSSSWQSHLRIYRCEEKGGIILSDISMAVLESWQQIHLRIAKRIPLLRVPTLLALADAAAALLGKKKERARNVKERSTHSLVHI